ncbi:MAG TPA: NAD-dependent succinate-semialdehyde dehydrogenase [Candidatus Saccharimonadales bacterium]|nr:NAD-dependent succinate-semialdehyde dehydrogenase [Candidatus Saccharimonadales bacterium]
MALQSINPKNKKLIKKFDELSDEQVEQKINQADAAFKSWRDTDFGERSKHLKSIAKELRNQKPDLAKIMTDEVGKTLSASEAEIEKCALTCEYYADNGENFLKPEEVETDASKSYVRFDPLGVVLAVMPWNFPLWQVFRFAAPALMAGNVGVLKHASNVQMSAEAIEKIMLDAGLPEGVFINLCIGSGKVAQVIDNNKVKAVTLTGSEKAGEAVASQSGRQIKKTVMELGGSDPFIVLEDADLDSAVEAAVTARLQYNGGQSCIAAKRFIVAKTVLPEFERKLVETVNQLVVGDPADPDTHVGPLANQQMVDDVDKQVKASVEKGAKILAGGSTEDTTGYFYPPTIVTNTTFDMPVCNQETFGPVFAIIGVEDAYEAIQVANDSIYGLGSNIFTGNAEKAMAEIAPKIEAGAVFINGPIKSDPRLPFGGVKKSGYGRELSHYGIKEFVNTKTVWVK